MPNFPHPYRNLRQFYRDTKTNILSISNVEQGATAYATDTNEIGSYNGTSWVWIKYDALNANNITQGTLGLDRIPNTLTGKDADTLDGQHGSFYQNANNINAGTLSTDRFSAYADLQAENKIGMISGRLPDANNVRFIDLFTTIKEDFSSTNPSGWSWATGTGFITPGEILIYMDTILGIRNTAGTSNVRSFLYRSFPSNCFRTFATCFATSFPSGHCTGIRWDDGGNNYIEVYLKHDTSSLPLYKFVGNYNGTETEFTSVRINLIPFFLMIGIEALGQRFSNWSVSFWVRALSSSYITIAIGLNWTPTRLGIVTRWTGDVTENSSFDWIGGNGTW